MVTADNGDIVTEIFSEVTHKDLIPNSVGIPWINDEGEIVQVSIGYTKYGNSTLYANGIWNNIKKLRAKDLSLVRAECSRQNITKLKW